MAYLLKFILNKVLKSIPKQSNTLPLCQMDHLMMQQKHHQPYTNLVGVFILVHMYSDGLVRRHIQHYLKQVLLLKYIWLFMLRIQTKVVNFDHVCSLVLSWEMTNLRSCLDTLDSLELWGSLGDSLRDSVHLREFIPVIKWALGINHHV